MKQSSGQNLLVKAARFTLCAQQIQTWTYANTKEKHMTAWRRSFKMTPVIGKSKQRRAKVKQTRFQRDRSHRSAYRFFFLTEMQMQIPPMSARAEECSWERRRQFGQALWACKTNPSRQCVVPWSHENKTRKHPTPKNVKVFISFSYRSCGKLYLKKKRSELNNF